MFKHHPVMLLEKLLDDSAGMNRGIVENQHQNRLGKPLVQLMQEFHEHLRGAALTSLPIKPLGPQMESPEHRGALTLGRLRGASWLAFAKPASMHIGLIGEVGFIHEKHLNRVLQLAFGDGLDDLCHPSFFSSVVGASWGTVCVKRL